MKKINKTQLINIAKKDCAVDGFYCDVDGKTCYIGALLLKVGVSKKELMKAGAVGIYAHQLNGWCKKLRAKFCLSVDQLVVLQEANDVEKNVSYRRTRVIKVIKELVFEP